MTARPEEVIMSRMVSILLLTGLFLLSGIFAIIVAPTSEAKNSSTMAGPLPAPTTPVGTPDPAPINRQPPEPVPDTTPIPISKRPAPPPATTQKTYNRTPAPPPATTQKTVLRPVPVPKKPAEPEPNPGPGPIPLRRVPTNTADVPPLRTAPVRPVPVAPIAPVAPVAPKAPLSTAGPKKQ